MSAARNGAHDTLPFYPLKQRQDSSHGIILRWLAGMQPARVLDLGCSSGLLADRTQALGHEVTGVDFVELTGVQDRMARFVLADVDRGLPEAVVSGGPYDVVVAADILEHLRAPERVLTAIHPALTPGGTLITSVPNFGHWYPRARTALGRFEYESRGLLDRGHIRFFTRRTMLALLRDCHFAVIEQQTTGLPIELLFSKPGPAVATLQRVDRAAVAIWPTLFAYQFVCLCTPTPALASSSSTTVAGDGGAHG